MNRRAILVAALVVVAAGGAVGVALAPGWLGKDNGRAEVTDAACSHGLVASRCPFCTPSLVTDLGFCEGHGVPEAFCTRCNPEVIVAFRARGDWCGEHGLPESQCVICHPELRKASDIVGSDGESPPLLHLTSSEEFPRYRRAPNVRCATETLQVRLASTEVAGAVGLELAEIQRRPITETILCQAEIAYDGNRHAQVSSRVGGTVHRVEKDLGDRVEAGEVLVIVDSIELGSAKAEMLQAQELLDLWEKHDARERRLLQQGVATEKDSLEAETKVAESQIAVSRARQRLRNLGLLDEQIDAVAKTRDTSSLLPLRAPFAGTIVERTAALGEVVQTTTGLFRVADMRRMWAMLDVYEADVAKVAVGQPAVFFLEGLRGETFGGQITWISSDVDPRTRTVKARAELSNPEGVLRANMFGKARVTVHEREEVVTAPRAAVQWEGCCNIVFVKLDDVTFAPKRVRLGCESGGYYEILAGLDPGEVVVTQGSFFLKTEILKGSIGAGCCEPAG